MQIGHDCHEIKGGAEKFTLIELLVVISIIAILAAILLPALNMTKLKAQTIQCVNNQKQCSYGQMMYANDFNGWCFGESMSVGWGRVLGNGPYAMMSYGPINLGYIDCKVMSCPSLPDGVITRTSGSTVTYGGSGGYGMGLPSGVVKSALTPAGGLVYLVSTKLITKPSISVMTADTTDINKKQQTYLINRTDAQFALLSGGQPIFSRPHFRHNGKNNIAYYDGHVAATDFMTFAHVTVRQGLTVTTWIYSQSQYFTTLSTLVKNP